MLYNNNSFPNSLGWKEDIFIENGKTSTKKKNKNRKPNKKKIEKKMKIQNYNFITILSFQSKL